MLARKGEHFSPPVEGGGHPGGITSILNALVVL